MINPLKVASDGYLSTTKRVLTIAVAGYLNFVEIPIASGSGGSNRDRQYHKQEVVDSSFEKRKRLKEEQDILAVLHVAMKVL